MNLPAESRLDDHALFVIPLATDQQLTDVELAAVRAGIALDWAQFDSRR